MKNNFLCIGLLCAVFSVLSACSPVLNRDLMSQGQRGAPFIQLISAPDAYKGRLFILGGLIVETRLIEQGSQIEVLAVPVDSLGYLSSADRSSGRFLAVFPRSQGLLDPVVYKRGREITLAGEFVEARKGKIDDMEYVFPVFEIREIYLWEVRREHGMPPNYMPYYNPSPFLYDPWGRPYSNPYWPPPAW